MTEWFNLSGNATRATNRGALPETCGDAAYVVDPLDVEAIAEGLRVLAHDHALREDLIERGRARAQRYSVDACGVAAWHALRQVGDVVPA